MLKNTENHQFLFTPFREEFMWQLPRAARALKIYQKTTKWPPKIYSLMSCHLYLNTYQVSSLSDKALENRLDFEKIWCTLYHILALNLLSWTNLLLQKEIRAQSHKVGAAYKNFKNGCNRDLLVSRVTKTLLLEHLLNVAHLKTFVNEYWNIS